jgi:hypothetical protein
MRSRLAGSSHAVARSTGTGYDPGVAEGGRDPGRRAVTSVARSGGLHMFGRFAGSRAAIVASGAASRCNTRVAEGRRQPGCSAVTDVA